MISSIIEASSNFSLICITNHTTTAWDCVPTAFPHDFLLYFTTQSLLIPLTKTGLCLITQCAGESQRLSRINSQQASVGWDWEREREREWLWQRRKRFLPLNEWHSTPHTLKHPHFFITVCLCMCTQGGNYSKYSKTHWKFILSSSHVLLFSHSYVFLPPPVCFLPRFLGLLLRHLLLMQAFKWITVSECSSRLSGWVYETQALSLLGLPPFFLPEKCEDRERER